SNSALPDTDTATQRIGRSSSQHLDRVPLEHNVVASDALAVKSGRTTPGAGASEVPHQVRVDRRGDVEHRRTHWQRKRITATSHVYADQPRQAPGLASQTRQTGIVQNRGRHNR